MKDGVVVLYDVDADYAKNVMVFLNQKENFPFLVKITTSKEAFTEIITQGKVDLLLIAYELVPEIEEIIQETKILVLVDQPSQESVYETIFRFQAMENVVHKILEVCKDACVSRKAIKKAIYTFYSPIGGIGKTGISAATAKVLSEHSKTLFISFSLVKERVFQEGESAKRQFIQFLMDLRNHSIDEETDLTMYCNRLDKLFYIPDSYYQQELWNLSVEDVEFLMELLMKQTFFESIVFDVGFLNSAMFEVMRFSQRIYLLTRDSLKVESRVNNFFELLKFKQEEGILKKIERVPVKENLFSHNSELEGEWFQEKAIIAMGKRLAKNESGD